MAGWLRNWAVAATLLLCGSCSGPAGADAGRVLGIFYFAGHSHFIVIERLLKELAARGHQVDVYSHFPQKTPLPNYTDFSLEGATHNLVNSFTIQELIDFQFFNLLYYIWEDNVELCRKAAEHPALQALAHSKQRYDLVVAEAFGVDCAYGYAHKLGAPVVAVSTLAGLPWGQERVGNPANPAYVPNVFLPLSPRMSLWQRVVNVVVSAYTRLGEKRRGQAPTDALLRAHLGDDMPPLGQLVRNTSLVLVNSHFSTNGVRPSVPGYVEVGGMHVDPLPGQLPERLSAFVDGAGDEGVLLVTFGSLVRAETMPASKLSAFVRVLGALPQRVVWKVNGSLVPGGVPSNVYASTYLPQQALLSHPKTRAFVTHGGVAGTMEAVYWAVPVVVVPFFTDQFHNANTMREFGAGRELAFADLTAESLGEVLDDVLNNPRYRERMRELSRLFRDRPQSPLQTAVYWAEYVMRHRGAPHLRSAAVDLAWYQELLLDVAAVLLAATMLLLAMLWLGTRAILRCLRACRLSKKDKIS